MISKNAYLPALVTLAAVVLGTTSPLSWGRSAYHDHFIEVDVPNVPEDAMIVLLGGHPMAYVAPYMPTGVTVIGLENNFLKSGQDNVFIDRVRVILEHAGGPLMAVVPRHKIPDSQILERFGYHVAVEDCESVESNIGQNLRICPLQKTDKR